ncbi:protein S100-G-like [Acanthochromis polyacanthus]|uniref:protein S100-G-like n=1 Tax=Acanthochromis polyacanthus TaxID=80966 RepID=UPI000B8F9D28|nr:protein S100-G-like [Acanthochromis polyacanthus]
MACPELKEKFDRHAGEDGFLDLEEFKKLIKSEIDNERIREKVLNRASTIFSKKDENKDGKLSFEEFEKCSRLAKKLRDKEKKGEPLEDSE